MAPSQNSIASATGQQDQPAPMGDGATDTQSQGKKDESALAGSVTDEISPADTSDSSVGTGDSSKQSVETAVVTTLQPSTPGTTLTGIATGATPSHGDGDSDPVKRISDGQADTASRDQAPKPTRMGGAAAILEASKKVAQNAETWRTSRALVLALVILAMTTVPALYISLLASKFVVGTESLDSPSRFTVFIFAYAVIKSDLFNLFTVAALPTLTAYFGSSDSKYREGFLPWLLFTYFIVLFVATFVPEVVGNSSYSGSQLWTSKIEAMGTKVADINIYLTNVRNGAIAGIAVLTGIKLAS